jgi:NADH-quinone oxidoreductase subunit A
VGFYNIALAFLIFDVETALLYPWAHSFHTLAKTLGPPILTTMLVFVALLLVALVYIWNEGVLDWAGRARTQGRKVQ